MNEYKYIIDYEYDADDEYEEDSHPQISRQTFMNIGKYMIELWNGPRDTMDRVLAELVALHGCREKAVQPLSINIDYVGVCKPPLRSVSSELFSLCSNETDESVFKYYISDDDINVMT